MNKQQSNILPRRGLRGRAAITPCEQEVGTRLLENVCLLFQPSVIILFYYINRKGDEFMGKRQMSLSA